MDVSRRDENKPAKVDTDHREEEIMIPKDLNSPRIQWKIKDKDQGIVKFWYDPTEVGTSFNPPGYTPGGLWTDLSRWYFGDGESGTGNHVEHTYALSSKDKVYQVSLIIYSCGGGHPSPGIWPNDQEDADTTINLAGDPLKAVIDYKIIDLNKDGFTTIEFSAEQSRGSNLRWDSCRWRFSDGAQLVGPKVVRTYASQGRGAKQYEQIMLTVFRTNVGDQPSTTSKIINIQANLLRPLISYERAVRSDPNCRTFIFTADHSEGSRINWQSTKWEFPDTGAIVPAPPATIYGPTVSYTFPVRQEVNRYPVIMTIFRANPDGTQDTKSITEEIQIQGEPLIPVISYRLDESNRNMVHFDALQSRGEGINWTPQAIIWNFGEGYQGQGTSISHKYDITAENRSYPVTLTISRYNGESKSITKVIDIAADQLKAVIDYQLEKKLTDGRQTVVFRAGKSLGSDLDWSRCTWHFPDYGQVLYGPVVSFTYLPESDVFQHPVILEMFRLNARGLIGDMAEEKVYVRLAADPLVPTIKYTTKEDAGRIVVVFDATQSQGSNILWDRAKWSFGDGAEGYGPLVSHSYNRDSRKHTYPVILTLCRQSGTIMQETKSTTMEIDITADPLQAKFTWEKLAGSDGSGGSGGSTGSGSSNANSVRIRFNANASKGQNINWSMCSWNFGEGWDQQSFSVSSQNTDQNNSTTSSSKQSSTANYANGPVVEHVFIGPFDNISRYRQVTLTIYRVDSTTGTTTSYDSVTQTVDLLR